VNLPADGGLSHVEKTRCARKPSVLYDGFEVAQMPELHGLNSIALVLSVL
jgi:hypothetical protein